MNLVKHGWTYEHWIANGGYGKNNNRFRETIYYSPLCQEVPKQTTLF